MIYNLGSQNGFSNREVIKAVEKEVGKKVPCTDAPRREGDPAVLVASSEKIKKELGWEAKYKNIQDSIKSAYLWRQKNPKGYLSV
jgi:UDP-glucose 4-epimerase